MRPANVPSLESISVMSAGVQFATWSKLVIPSDLSKVLSFGPTPLTKRTGRFQISERPAPTAIADLAATGLATGGSQGRLPVRVTFTPPPGAVAVEVYRAPFGGYKASGFGRDLGADSLRDYTQVKSVWMNLE